MEIQNLSYSSFFIFRRRNLPVLHKTSGTAAAFFSGVAGASAAVLPGWQMSGAKPGGMPIGDG
jgi:hypothetical protein